MNGVTEAEARNGMQMAHDLDFLGQILNAAFDKERDFFGAEFPLADRIDLGASGVGPRTELRGVRASGR